MSFLNFFLFILASADYLKFDSIVYNSNSLSVSISTYDNNGNELPIDNLEIYAYSIPETTIGKTSKILTTLGKAQFNLFIAQGPSLQLVVSAQGYTPIYSDIFESVANDLKSINLTPSSLLTIVNQDIVIGMALIQDPVSLVCDYIIYEASGETIQGDTNKLSVLGETSALISFSSPGIKTVIVECASDYIYTIAFNLVVQKSALYTILINVPSPPQLEADDFSVTVNILDSSGADSKKYFIVSLGIVGCSDFYGINTLLYNGQGTIEVPSLMIPAKGIFYVFASILNSYYGMSSFFFILYDQTEKYPLITLLDTVTLGSIFSAKVEIYFYSSIYYDEAYDIQLICYPLYSIYYFATNLLTIGTSTFTELSITENGIYVLYVSALGILNKASKTINLMLDIYQNLSFIIEPPYLLNTPYSLNIDIYSDIAMTIPSTSDVEIIIELYLNDAFQNQYSSLTTNGNAIFTNIYNEYGNYEIKSKIVGAFDSNIVFTIAPGYIKLEFLNSIKPTNTNSIFTVICTLYADYYFTIPITVGSVSITINISPQVTIQGPTQISSASGVSSFENLNIMLEGDYYLYATGVGLTDSTSETISIKNRYLKMTLINKPATTIDLFSVLVEVYNDKNFIEVDYNGEYLVNIKLNSTDSLQGITEKSIIGGSATFDDLIILNGGEYLITASSVDGPFSYTYPYTLIILTYSCPEGEYLSNLVCCKIGSTFNVLTEVCECDSGTYLIGDTCGTCTATGSTYNSETLACECLTGLTIIDNACTCAVIGSSYNTETLQCECPIGLDIINNECACSISGSVYNTETQICECPNDQYVLENTCVCLVVGAVFDSRTLQCICPEDQYELNNICVCIVINSIFNTETQKCECPDGQYVLNNACVCIAIGSSFNTETQTCECPAGQYILNDICQCIPGATYNTLTDACECQIDQQIVDNVCVCIINGSTYNTITGNCECPSDQYVLNDICTCIVIGSTFNTVTGKCECPSDQYDLYDICTCIVIGSTFNTITGKCECPSDQYVLNDICTCIVGGSAFKTLTEKCECPINMF
ncbi:hypothetical protein SteCoe_6803 [Stentor coeruleus]|uniref:Uncharacterized protein n=1 Tax=Stentor coeruleus TaxID=5963 RepID=A0A1R2CP86_9CILI|nr:hypothetical protein SteCoe_6803 [Stentor coeruleus]